MISVQSEDFDISEEYKYLTEDNSTDGAVVTFVGLVRDFNQGNHVHGLTLEHYPGMTEKALLDIVIEAQQRWQLGRVRVIHRVGDLNLSDQIVFVGVTSPHREQAYEASQFIMDFLKNKAPFWKKERTSEGQVWVKANAKDKVANGTLVTLTPCSLVFR